MNNAFKTSMHNEVDGEGRKRAYISSLEGEAFHMAREVVGGPNNVTYEQVLE